jgi:hypothetical protein
MFSIAHSNPLSGYGNSSSILKFFWLLLLIPLSGAAQTRIAPDPQLMEWLGQQIFRNECNSEPACLPTRNAGENSPSPGIGHFIWYR